MNSTEIYFKVVDSADRFGAANPQQLEFLCSVLSKCESDALSVALIDVFAKCGVIKTSFERQELAGRILEKLKPKCFLVLTDIIRSTIPHWDVSVEQFPRYLAHVYGKAILIVALENKLENESDEKIKHALKTMRWWIGE
jgi:hypothetical protein